jgi:hypothetical protein|tara:strand:+ start:521 stop:661 length:141 start_codon:yes stop_codon:yes gene_type:complete
MISWKKIENFKFKKYQYKQPTLKPKQQPKQKYFLNKIPQLTTIRFD